MRTFRGLAAVAALVVVGSLGVGCSAQDPQRGCEELVEQGGYITAALKRSAKATNLAGMAVYLEEVATEVEVFRSIDASPELAVLRDDLASTLDTFLEESALRNKGSKVESATFARIDVGAQRILKFCQR